MDTIRTLWESRHVPLADIKRYGGSEVATAVKELQTLAREKCNLAWAVSDERTPAELLSRLFAD